MKKLLTIIAGLFLFSTAFAQVCDVSFSYVKPTSTTKRVYTIRTFEPCSDYATQIALLTAYAMTKQEYPSAIFLSGNTLSNNFARGKSHWATQHSYTVQ